MKPELAPYADEIATLVAFVEGRIKRELPGGAAGAMQVKVVYNGPVKAPIKAGDHIADLVVTTPDTPPQTMPLVAAADVAEAGFFGRAWAGLMSFFGR